MATQSPWFLRFPPEIISSIVSFLPNKDVKSLRLTCQALGEFSPFLLLTRVSFGQLVEHSTDHPKFRHEIREIIWDDARFQFAPLIWETMYPLNSNEGCPIWFTKGCEENLHKIKYRKYRDVDRPDHVARQHQIDAQMPLKACWKYYQQLGDDQASVIGSEDDKKAFLYGLERFPRLKRVTVTPAAHGWLFAPLYETPMIRAFPYGFNYPIPRGWNCDLVDPQVVEPLPWSEVNEGYKERWRGARIVLRLLSQAEKHKHNVSELSFDSKQLHTGLNFLIFDRPCEEYNQFAAIMKRPGFRRLHLSLLTGSSGDWTGFQSGLFRQAVSLVKELTHVHLSTTFDVRYQSSMRDPPIPLKEVLPIKEWPNLSHLALFRFSVDTSELMGILKLAPSSLRSLDLEFMEFPFDELCLTGLLERMREELDWTVRDQSLKPTVTIAMEGHRRWPGRFIKLSDEVASFLYGSGENPLDGTDTRSPKDGYGTNHDVFEAEYTRPNVNFQDLKKLGIIC
ncbi:uncharacterized protein N7482_000973 [Penicillium canariense]|uniref:F-box domain-containing protein n=1 Tax=Penicillium canariense TaxID=189055 RepID=A0A9W9IGB4_9EURO|nr:uncharacterized protein N7482_000973 [Penicillium canariense]KAJ5175096.1 hypothetical protein N7482_000973 [Penicillium canariense]